ncbi:MAG: hypothetical protein J0L58_13520, partial [Burkholderiales bacterium]|nr:hypothetical protein [Burkholderiales bacterium]
MFNRRHLLATAAALPALSLASNPDRTPPRWIVVLLRGAVDGLSVCAPYEERAYRDERPGIAIAPPGSEHGLIDLGAAGPKFGLHPALAPLMPLWQAGQFGLLHASGLVGAGRRSHFEAQDELEAGGRGTLSEGWLARLMADGAQADAQAVRALYSGPIRPKLLAGA